MKRYTVQVKLADYQKDWNTSGDPLAEVRKMVWTDMHETDDQADADERMYGYRRRNFTARVVTNVHPSRS